MAETILQTDPKDRLPIDADFRFQENLEALVRDGQRGMVLNLLLDLHTADIARLLPHLEFGIASQLFHWLPEDRGANILTDLDDDYRATLLEESPPSRVHALIDEMDTDDAADVLADLPDKLVQDVLPHLEDAEDVEQLLRYDEETAGGLMNADYVAVSADATVGDATEEVRRLAEEVDPVFVVYALDEDDRLAGRVSLKRLLLTRAFMPIRKIMVEDVVSVTPEVDQEEVARIMERYDLVALPVVDEDGRLLGRITIDDVVDVIREEAEEDIQRMSGIAQDEELTDSVVSISRGRLVWLFVGLAGALMSGVVIQSFEETIQEVVALATFIPVVMAMAGNVGIQSSAIVVQGLASGELWESDVPKRIGKELAVALINGIALALVLGIVVWIMVYVKPDWEISPIGLVLTVSLSLFIIILLAAVIGATIPLLLNRVNIDPAIATGPFITTTNDILGLIIYFGIATVLLLSSS